MATLIPAIPRVEVVLQVEDPSSDAHKDYDRDDHGGDAADRHDISSVCRGSRRRGRAGDGAARLCRVHVVAGVLLGHRSDSVVSCDLRRRVKCKLSTGEVAKIYTERGGDARSVRALP